MQILSNAYIQDGWYVLESSLISILEDILEDSKWIAHRAVPVQTCDQRFVQNMRVSRSNYAVYLRWHATSLARHSKRWRSFTHSACEKSIRFLIPINYSIQRIIYSFITLLIPNLKCESHRCSIAYILPLHFCNVLAYAFVAYTRTAKASVRENCLCFQWDLPVSLLLAIY